MDPSLITKYFSGDCSDDEQKQVLNWFQTSSGQAFLRNQIKIDWQQLTLEKKTFPRDIDSERLFNQILKSIKTDDQSVKKDCTAGVNMRLDFENEPLWKISQKLERVYDINIEFQSEQLKALNLTADFRQQNAEVTLQTIATMLDIEFEKISSNSFKWLKPPGAL